MKVIPRSSAMVPRAEYAASFHSHFKLWQSKGTGRIVMVRLVTISKLLSLPFFWPQFVLKEKAL